MVHNGDDSSYLYLLDTIDLPFIDPYVEFPQLLSMHRKILRCASFWRTGFSCLIHGTRLVCNYRHFTELHFGMFFSAFCISRQIKAIGWKLRPFFFVRYTASHTGRLPFLETTISLISWEVVPWEKSCLRYGVSLLRDCNSRASFMQISQWCKTLLATFFYSLSIFRNCFMYFRHSILQSNEMKKNTNWNNYMRQGYLIFNIWWLWLLCNIYISSHFRIFSIRNYYRVMWRPDKF